MDVGRVEDYFRMTDELLWIESAACGRLSNEASWAIKDVVLLASRPTTGRVRADDTSEFAWYVELCGTHAIGTQHYELLIT